MAEDKDEKKKKEEIEKQGEPVAPAAASSDSAVLAEINAKLNQLIELLSAAPAADGSVETAKAEKAPEESAGTGEGDEKKLPEAVTEKTHEAQPGTQVPNKVDLEKALEPINKAISEIKKAIDGKLVTKSTTQRPSAGVATPKEIEKGSDLALDIAKGKKVVNWGELTDRVDDDLMDATKKAIGRSD